MNMAQNVGVVFDAAPALPRAGMLALRTRILDQAARLDVALREELRWGQPAYLSDTGSTLRLGQPRSGGFAIYAHCATSLIGDFAQTCPCRTEKNRAVLFDSLQEAAAVPVELLISAALQYHARPERARASR